MLINLTNHPSERWAAAQHTKARELWGSIVDVPFPQVDPTWTADQVRSAAQELSSHVLDMKPTAILCQGEMGMAFALTQLFQQAGIPVYTATTAREVEEHLQADGSTRKQATFRFIQFREYVSWDR